MLQPPYVPWAQAYTKSYTKGEWRDLQLVKFLDFNINCNSRDVKQWLVNHEVDPWPKVTKEELKKHLKRLRASINMPNEQKKKRRTSSDRSFFYVLSEIRSLIAKVDDDLQPKLKEQLVRELLPPQHKTVFSKAKALDNIVEVCERFRSKRGKDAIGIKRILIGAACAPNIATNEIRDMFRLQKKTHVVTYFDFRKKIMEGGTILVIPEEIYTNKGHYSELIYSMLRSWWDSDKSSTHDTYNRSVKHITEEGNRIVKHVRHIIGVDREKNHERFVDCHGEECIEICEEEEMKNPSIPGRTILESYRPNYCIYFKSSTFGECELCKLSYNNYLIMVEECQAHDPDISLPETCADFVKLRICSDTKAKQRHECEDGNHTRCTFRDYFIKRNTNPKKKVCDQSFEEKYGFHFLLEKTVSWFEFETRGVEGVAEKFDYPVWKKVEGPLEVFLEVFQDIMISFVQHKSFYWHQNKEVKKLIKANNFYLHPDAIAAFADYSVNPKKYSGRTLTQVQYQQLPEISLLNIITYSSEGGEIPKRNTRQKKIKREIFQDVYEFISDDAHHDTNLFPKSLFQYCKIIKKKTR